MRYFAITLEYTDACPTYDVVQAATARELADKLMHDCRIAYARMAWRGSEVTDGNLHIVPMAGRPN